MFQSIKNKFEHFEAIVQRMAKICSYILIFTVSLVTIIALPLLAILVVALLIWSQSSKLSWGRTTHGSACWAGLNDLIRSGCLFQHRGVMIGRTIGLRSVNVWRSLKALLFYPLRRSKEAVAITTLGNSKRSGLPVFLPENLVHAAVFGPSGAGKTTCFAAKMLLECGDSMVVLDSKGELAKLSAKHRASKFGHSSVVIDPFGVSDGCGFPPSRFNPFDLFRDDEAKIVDEARRIASSLIETTGMETDKFWTQSSSVLLTAIIAFLIAHANSEEANLNRLRDILASPNLMDQMLEFMEQSDKCGGLLRRLAGQISQLKGQTKASVFSVANSHVSFLDSIPIADSISESTFDAHELVTGKQTVYICLPIDRVSELSGLQRVIVSSFINLVFAAGEDRSRRVRLLLDEAATLGPMDALYNALNYGRSFGLRMMFLFQSTSQVERSFPLSKKDDFQATVASIFCGVNDFRTAKEVSEFIGQTTVRSRSDQESQNWGKSTSPSAPDQNQSVNSGTSNSTSFNEVSRSLIQPEEVLQLPGNTAIALLPNIRPILAEKVPYFEKKKTFLFRRLVSLGIDLLVVSLVASLAAILVWALTIGQSHPAVTEFGYQVERYFAVYRR